VRMVKARLAFDQRRARKNGVALPLEQGGVPKSCLFQAYSGQFRRTPAHDETAGSPLRVQTLRALPRSREQPENPLALWRTPDHLSASQHTTAISVPERGGDSPEPERDQNS